MLNSTCAVSAVGRCRIETVLQDMFGTSFEVLPHTTEQKFTCTNSDCNHQCECHAGIFLTAATNDAFQLRLRGLTRSDHTFDAVGTVRSLERAAVIRAARCAIRMLQQDQQLDELNVQLEYFVQQVSGDLEEACWFRTMADEVAACRPDDPLQELCSRILPQLRNLLHARSVLIIRDTPDTETSVLAVDSDTEDNAARHEVALQLIQQYQEEASHQACVWNRQFPVGESHADQHQPPCWLDGFVLVKIGSGRKEFGWLLALGRSDAVGDPAQSRRSESEFGTHESTLMETAAVLLATHAANCELFDEQEKTLVGMVTAMVNALDARDPYTRGHSHRVALISQRIGQELGLPEHQIEDIYLSGLLHDIGKIGVPDHVLLKNGPLNVDERRLIEQHTVIGHAILKPVRQLEKILPGVLHHHEQVDGSGYPSQLKGDRIPLAGRILAVADAYDAMTTCRPYRQAMPVSTAEQILLEGSGSHWDERMVDAFFSARADIRQLYERRDQTGTSGVVSCLQYGRFEDVSQSAVAELTATGMTRE